MSEGAERPKRPIENYTARHPALPWEFHVTVEDHGVAHPVVESGGRKIRAYTHRVVVSFPFYNQIDAVLVEQSADPAERRRSEIEKALSDMGYTDFKKV